MKNRLDISDSTAVSMPALTKAALWTDSVCSAAGGQDRVCSAAGGQRAHCLNRTTAHRRSDGIGGDTRGRHDLCSRRRGGCGAPTHCRDPRHRRQRRRPPPVERAADAAQPPELHDGEAAQHGAVLVHLVLGHERLERREAPLEGHRRRHLAPHPARLTVTVHVKARGKSEYSNTFWDFLSFAIR